MLAEVGPGLLTTNAILRTLQARNNAKKNAAESKNDERVEMKEMPSDDPDVIPLERVIVPPLPTARALRVRAAAAAANAALQCDVVGNNVNK